MMDNDIGENQCGNISNDYGKWLAHPPSGEEIFITGIAGAYPESRNLHEFRDNLYNQIDMVTVDDRRWTPTDYDIPERAGKIPQIEKFDAGFFGIHRRQADAMDPMVRILLEKTIEAIMDAGMNPKELENTNTGVFIGSSFSETEPHWFYKQYQKQQAALTGCTRSMISHRISYFLKLRGPSYNLDTACSSSLFALEQAYKSIRDGTCDRAIVGGINLCLHPYVTLQFFRLGVLSREGKCKVFDRDGDGYVRSEAASVIILQKAKDAKRNYCHVIHSKTNCDGFKPQSITYPSRVVQKLLLSDVYNECGVEPAELSYLEAHGTATYVGDPEEISSIDATFCKNRSNTLLIGSVKSNVGHSEPSSALTSIAKVIISMENGIIPPNLHYNKPREGVEPLESGRLTVVTENTPFQDDRGLIAVSSFGFGGGNAHAVLHWNEKSKSAIRTDGVPRLVCVSGRTPQTVAKLLNDLKNRKLDRELVCLYHNIFKTNIPGQFFRGFSIVCDKYGEIDRVESSHVKLKRPKLCIIFGELTGHFIHDLGKIPVCEKLFKNYEQILNSHQIESGSTLNGTIILLALAEIFKTIKLKPEFYFGYGFGDLVCAYLDGCLNLEQTILCAYLFSAKRATHKVDINENDTKPSTKETLSINGEVTEDKLKQAHEKFKEWINNNNEVQRKQCPVATSKIIKNATIVTIGSIPSDFNNSNALLIANETENLFNDLIRIVGRLYLQGFDFELDKIYPEVEFPVSRTTPMISPLIEWRQNDYFVSYYQMENHVKSGKGDYEITPQDEKWSYLSGHVVDGRNLFPATGYLMIVWQTLAFNLGTITDNMEVVFENCFFHRASNLPNDKYLELQVAISKGSGTFEITESRTVIASGRVYSHKCTTNDQFEFPQDYNGVLTMDTKDVYKELRLRGYNYSGAFKSIIGCNDDFTNGLIRWDNNWTTFIDNMLQLKVLQIDTRLLYVPINIKHLSINAKKHMAYVKSFEEEEEIKPEEHQVVNLPVKLERSTDSISCGGIEVRGLKAASITRKKLDFEPVLEKYAFVPNETKLTLTESLKVSLQIMLENKLTLIGKIAIGEITSDDEDNLAEKIDEILLDFPLVTSNGIQMIPRSQNFSDYDLLVGKHLWQSADNILDKISQQIKDSAFVLSRESPDFVLMDCANFSILTVHETPSETLVLFQRKSTQPEIAPVNIADCAEFTWLSDFQNLLKTDKTIIVYSQNQATNGIIGLTNCVRREPGSGNVRCVMIQSAAPDFDPDLEFYRKQLDKNMAVNVFKDGVWGTYRHLSILEFPKVPSRHCYANTLKKGDLSSIDWVEGPLSEFRNSQKELIYVYYSSLNFRDIMMASGKINSDVITMDRRKQECVQGFEFVGRTADGRRVMGFIEAGATATLLEADRNFLWDIPEVWSMEDAATIPAVYGTLIYAMFMRTQIRSGDRILIHSGTGGVGFAAIHLALHHGCEIFVTVGGAEKRQILKEMFPQIPETHIGNSRNTTFEQMIYQQTKGRGVDFVINSLSEDKLQASIRCLAPGGQFLEIGKFDLVKDTALQLMLLEKQASFHGIMLDLFLAAPSEEKQQLSVLFSEKIKEGAVKPFPRSVFNENEIENALRSMTTGKHIGKVLIKIRDEEIDKIAIPPIKIIQGRARYIANPNNTYVIIGGLGGFGLELTDWLILRGARKLVLNSRNGVKNGYQASRIRIWRNYGAEVLISTEDVSTQVGCETLLQNANELGSVAAIFNLAVELKDALFNNQTEDTFKASFCPKAIATQNLDEISRKICPDLRDFVVFSSVSCGRGNPGQSNYGMSNSVMERICENRREEGFPALAVQWGAVGDVGLVAEMLQEKPKQIGGTLPQPILSCLSVLESFLLQKESTVVSSILLGQKRAIALGDDLVQIVAQILGIKDMKTVSLHTPLSELGMDSMTAQEIQQTLEREFQIFLGLQDIRNITLDQLHSLQDDIKGAEQHRLGIMNNLIRHLIDIEEMSLKYIAFQSTEKGDSTHNLILFPGIEGTSKCFAPLANNLNVPAVCLQYSLEEDNSSVVNIAESVIPTAIEFITKSKPFCFLAYSYGVVIAIHVVHILEQMGYRGQLICIDGSPEMFPELIKQREEAEVIDIEIQIICHMLAMCISSEIVAKNREIIWKARSLKERLDIAEELVDKHGSYSAKDFRTIVDIICQRISSVKSLSVHHKIDSKITLYKPASSLFAIKPHDYNLNQYSSQEVEIKECVGDHVTILESVELANDINTLFFE